MLNANQQARVNHIAPVTNIAPEYAPVGKHLIAASHLGVPPSDLLEATLFEKTLREVKQLFTGDKRAQEALATYQPLACYAIPHAQFRQPVGIYAELPGNCTENPNVFIAGELTKGSSINAAMQSGEDVAEMLLSKESTY
jgi:phytoene dehydrogenase-like protein